MLLAGEAASESHLGKLEAAAPEQFHCMRDPLRKDEAMWRRPRRCLERDGKTPRRHACRRPKNRNAERRIQASRHVAAHGGDCSCVERRCASGRLTEELGSLTAAGQFVGVPVTVGLVAR